MPKVPVFNGGVPQTSDQARATSGGMYVPPRIQTADYESIIKTALTPVNALASVTDKYLTVERQKKAKDVKALADNIVVDYLNFSGEEDYGENGFYTLSGKDASDQLQPYIDRQRKFLEDRTKDLDDESRQVVFSVVAPRIEANVTQAKAYSSKQLDSYHISSAQSVLQKSIDDGARHYADDGYADQTLGTIGQQRVYIGQIRHESPQQIRQNMQSDYDSLQSQRAKVGVEDNPKWAMEFLQRDDIKKTMSPEQYLATSNYVWARAKKAIAGDLVFAGVMVEPLKTKSAYELAKDPNFKTGLAVIDNLPSTRKLELFSDASTIFASTKKQVDQEFESMVKNSVAIAEENGTDENQLSQEAFIEAYGPDQGIKKYHQYQDDLDAAGAGKLFSGLSNEEIDAELQGSKPDQSSSQYAAEKSNWDKKAKKAAEIKKARAADPIGFAIENSQTPELDFSNESSIRARCEALPTIQRQTGESAAFFSRKELQRFNSDFNAKETTDQIEYVSTVAGGLDDRALSALVNQTRGKLTPATVSLIALSSGKKTGEDASTTVRHYLEGKAGIKAGTSKLDMGVDQTRSGVIRDTPSLATAMSSVMKVVKDPTLRDLYQEMLIGVTSWHKQQGESDKEAARLALKEVLGGHVKEYKGAPIVVPENLSVSDVKDAVSIAVSKSKGSLYKFHKNYDAYEEFPEEVGAALLKNSQLVNAGSAGRYYFVHGGQVILDEQRKPIVVTVK